MPPLVVFITPDAAATAAAADKVIVILGIVIIVVFIVFIIITAAVAVVTAAATVAIAPPPAWISFDIPTKSKPQQASKHKAVSQRRSFGGSELRSLPELLSAEHFNLGSLVS